MSNPEQVKPCALVLGHSFVRRLKAFANKNRSSRNLNLEDTCQISLSGIGGRTVDKLMRFDLAKLHVLQPNVIVLEIGSNQVVCGLRPRCIILTHFQDDVSIYEIIHIFELRL